MRTYQLYLIDDVFANYYYGRERMFYQLFKELEESNSTKKEILLKQVHYITKPIPALKIHTLIMENLYSNSNFFVENGSYQLKYDQEVATLHIQDRRITIQSSGKIDCEMVFMDVLAGGEYNFLAIDIENIRYGWLKPVKEKRILERKYQNR